MRAVIKGRIYTYQKDDVKQISIDGSKIDTVDRSKRNNYI